MDLTTRWDDGRSLFGAPDPLHHGGGRWACTVANSLRTRSRSALSLVMWDSFCQRSKWT
jgi:hypothetical protein